MNERKYKNKHNYINTTYERKQTDEQKKKMNEPNNK